MLRLYKETKLAVEKTEDTNAHTAVAISQQSMVASELNQTIKEIHSLTEQASESAGKREKEIQKLQNLSQ